MGTEIERKFLVTDDSWKTSEPVYYCQGYLNRDKYRTVRVRIAEDQGFLTIKGPTVGATRSEYEYVIPLEDAQELLGLCDKPLVEKYRRIIRYKGMSWEVDEFLGDNQGLVVAEIELDSESQAFDLPTWVGKEVTNDPKYFNSRLSSKPFSTWGIDD
ncbi:MAG: CYTH domain-containing protein [Mariniblastus sp.]|nr:CYTH domain-containing protein [Mariniblastus sp.]